jgi:hypothetical protein
MSEDRFLDDVRRDATGLRFELDSVAAARLRARVRARLTEPTVTHFLAAWIRPVAASLTALAIMAGIAITVLDSDQNLSFGGGIEYSMGGDVFSVGE